MILFIMCEGDVGVDPRVYPIFVVFTTASAIRGDLALVWA